MKDFEVLSLSQIFTCTYTDCSIFGVCVLYSYVLNERNTLYVEEDGEGMRVMHGLFVSPPVAQRLSVLLISLIKPPASARLP